MIGRIYSRQGKSVEAINYYEEALTSIRCGFELPRRNFGQSLL
jgi:hypothetical protein